MAANVRAEARTYLRYNDRRITHNDRRITHNDRGITHADRRIAGRDDSRKNNPSDTA
jgi:hypothetical protein